MKKLILVGALALLAACGDTKVQTDSSNTSKGGVTTPKTDDTVTVKDVGDMPPKCIELFSDFLKKIEPEVSKIDWSKATAAQMSTLDESFQKESDDMDAQMTAAGCDKYNLDATDEQTFEQLTKIAAAEAPGTVGFLTFIKSLSEAASTPGRLGVRVVRRDHRPDRSTHRRWDPVAGSTDRRGHPDRSVGRCGQHTVHA